MEVVTQQLQDLQAQLRSQTMKINREADVRMEVARIDAASRERVAEIKAESDQRLAALSQRAGLGDAQEAAPSM